MLVSTRLILILSVIFIFTTPAKSTPTISPKKSFLPSDNLPMPDTTGLWYHIRNKQIDLANSELNRLKSRYPHWRPNRKILDSLDEINNKNSTETGLDKNLDIKKNKVSEYEKIIKRINEIEKNNWANIDHIFLKKASKLVDINGIGGHHELLGWIFIENHQYNLAIHHFQQVKLADNDKRYLEGISVAVQGLLNEALLKQDLSAINSLSQKYPDVSLASQISEFAWTSLKKHEYHTALVFFEFINEPAGQVYALQKLKQLQKARNLACENTNELELLDICVNYFAQEQLERFEVQQYRKSINAAKEILKIQPLSLGQLELYAWANLELGEKRTSAEAFSRLLQASPENSDFSNALLQLYIDEPSQLAVYTNKHPSIKTQLIQQQYTQAFSRKQFDLAYRLNPNIGAREDITIYAGTEYRDRSGSAGLDQLNAFTHQIGLTNLYNDWRWDVKFVQENLDSKTPGEFQWFGEGQVELPFESISQVKDQGLGLSISTQQSNYNLFANISYLLFDQPTPTALTGQLSATWFSKRHIYSFSIFRNRKNDSLLSTTGTFLEDSTENWGGVISSGARFLTLVPVINDWSLAANVSAEYIDGNVVEDNSSLSARVDLNTDISNSLGNRFDYFRVGPFVSWQGYEQNLSGFTLGHGGYFSPQSLLSMGIYGELLTEEMSVWQIRARGNLSYNIIKQEQISRFPLQDLNINTPIIETSNTDGIGGEFVLEAQYKLNDHWLISAFAKQAFAVEFQEQQIGIQINWNLGSNKGVLSDSLPLSSYRLKGFAL